MKLSIFHSLVVVIAAALMLGCNAVLLYALLFQPFPNALAARLDLTTALLVAAGIIVLAGSTLLVLLFLVKQARALHQMRNLFNSNEALTSANQQLLSMTTTDTLTGLANRTYFQEYLNQFIEDPANTNGAISLLLIDLDRFKEVNDTLGHTVGDVLLQQVAKSMRTSVRASDFVARLGGDEFAILLPNTTHEGALVFVETLMSTLKNPITVGDQALDVEISVGIATYPAHGADGPTLLRHADIAMYVAKKDRLKVAAYSPDQDQHTPYRLALMNTLRHAITDNQLHLYYQPVLDLDGGHVVGVEALLRWMHPEFGLIPPDHFIPLAEQSGLMESLTEWVLHEALAQWSTWRDAGRVLTMSVNLSVRTAHDDDLPDYVAQLLETYNMPAEYLMLEITESAIMSDPKRAQNVLERLAALGVRVAIDDFGTGYSSLNYLTILPVHEVKVDKSFVMAMDGDPKYAAIVRSVVAIAHALNMSVVAEGVETERAWDDLGTLGCDLAQGFFMSRPLPAAELETWLSETAVIKRVVAH